MSDPRIPTDRQASRAHTWAVELMSAPSLWAGIVAIDAPTREEAWTLAYADAATRTTQGKPTVPQGVALAPLTHTEYATVRAFLSGRAVRLRADRATGLASIEPARSGRVYVHDIMRPRGPVDLDPQTMAEAGKHLDRLRNVGTTPSPVTGKVYTTDSEREAYAIRCAAHKVPDAFEPTGEVAVWGAWAENTSPTFPATPEGRAAARRLARLMDGSRASLVLDGVTIATTHSTATGSGGEHGRPLLRVLNDDAIEALGPRAQRIRTVVVGIAKMLHPDSRPDIEYVWTSAELDYAQRDPRDGTHAPMLTRELPTTAAGTPMEAQRERLITRLMFEPAERWKLAAEWPEHFTTDADQADPDDMPDAHAQPQEMNR